MLAESAVENAKKLGYKAMATTSKRYSYSFSGNN
jgi:predicted extracellular nuclease